MGQDGDVALPVTIVRRRNQEEPDEDDQKPREHDDRAPAQGTDRREHRQRTEHEGAAQHEPRHGPGKVRIVDGQRAPADDDGQNEQGEAPSDPGAEGLHDRLGHGT